MAESEKFIHGSLAVSHIDLIFGHIGKYFNEEVKKVADIFTITENYMSGALSIFRNIDKVKNLYKEGYGWQFIFQSPYHFAYDEFLRIDDRAMIGYAGDKRSLQSFSDVVKSFAKSNVIKLYNPEYIGFEQRPGLVTYDNGHVYQGGKEWIFFHYVIAKQSVTWTLPKWNDIPDKFYVNRYGFYRDTDKPLSLVNLLSEWNYQKQIFSSIKRKRKTVVKLLKKMDIRKIMNALIKQ